jgi:NADPH2:quinone reductase
VTGVHPDAGVVLVTAGAGGIGRVIAEAFQQEGYAVHVCDIDPQAVDAFLAANPCAGASVADVADPAMVKRVFAELDEQHGRLDVLVNNAGISGPIDAVQNIEPEDWNRTIQVNLNSHFYFAREAVPRLRRAGGGSIIMMASTAAYHGCPLRAPYAAGKWGLLGLMKTMAMELGPSGIRVNAICPGSVEGERIDRVMSHDARVQGKSLDIRVNHPAKEPTMKAAWFEQFGAAGDVLRVGEMPCPEPSTDQVVVRLHTSGVNPSDVKKRAGAFPNLLDDGPVIPHSDGAGVVESVGEGVPENRIGERVWVYQAQFERRFGTAAEFVCINRKRAIPLPGNTSFEVGACLGIPAMTAHRCVFADGPVDGQSVLVTGGAGRVGHYAIQWAAQAGARVVATASSDADAGACIEAGALEVINHRTHGWGAEALKANGNKAFQRVIDVEFGANLEQTLDLVQTSGVIATYSSTQAPQPVLPFLRMMYLDLTLRLVIVYAMPESAKSEAIADLDRYLRQERLIHRVAHSVPLDEVAHAHELIEQGGFRGCVVVTI